MVESPEGILSDPSAHTEALSEGARPVERNAGGGAQP